MKKEIIICLLCLGMAILLVGMLIIPLEKAVATNIRSPLAGEILVNPISGLVTTEAGGSVTFTVVLSSQPGSAVTFGLSSSDPSEGTVTPTTVTLNPGNWDVEQIVTVTGVDDPIIDGDIGYQVITSPAVSNDPEYDGVDAADVSVTNQDNDIAGITVNPLAGLVTSEGGGTANFTVVLDTQPEVTVTIGLSSSDQTEGTVLPISLTFDPVNWNVEQTVTVTGVDDQDQDGDISYQIITAPAISSDTNYSDLDAANVSVINQDNDAAGFMVNPGSGLVTSEAGGIATVTVVLNTQPDITVTVGLTSSDLSEGTVAPINLTFDPNNWNIEQTVTVTGVDDLVMDGDVGYLVITAPAISDDPNYAGVDAVDVSVTNQDNDTAGIAVDPVSGLLTTEAGGAVTFTVVLTSQPEISVTVGLSSSDLSEGMVSPASLVFDPANWAVTQTVTVTGVDDLVMDGDINYQIHTAPAISDDPNYAGMDAPDVSVTNQDDDIAMIDVSPTSGLVTTEAGGTVTFTVVLVSQPEITVTVELTSSDPGEGIVSPISLTFDPSNWATRQIVTVTGVDDLIMDGDISYQIITAPAISSDPNYSALNAPDVSVTNQDNDVAGISVNPVSGLLTSEAGGVAVFTVVLDSQPEITVTVGLSSSDLSEGTVSPTSLIFTPANWSVVRTVTVTGVDDQEEDGNIGYQIITAPAVSSDPNYTGLDAANVSVTNQDNDSAGFTVNPGLSLITTESGGTITFTVALNTQPVNPVMVALSSSDTSEGTVSPASLTFDPLNWTSGRTVTVTGVDDLVMDGDIAYQAITAPAVSSDPNYSGVDAADVSVINQDDDTAGISVNPISGLITTEAGGAVTFTVGLSSQPTADVIIDLNSSDPSEASVFPIQLTFAAANWATTQVITVSGVDDQLDDGDQAFFINTANASSNDAIYDGWNIPDVSGTNIDDDFTPLAVGESYLTNATPNQPLIVVAPGVLINDSDADNDPLVALKMSDPAHGEVDLDIDGSFVYTPTQTFTQVITDSFSYVASDGYQDSDLATVEIIIDPVAPTINWISPVANGEILQVYNQSVQLETEASDNISFESVKYSRWDAVAMTHIDIGMVYKSPYQWNLDTWILNCGWNQIFAEGRDEAGNSSAYPYPFIWIYRVCQIFLPNIKR